MKKLYLKRGKEESLLRFHPWVFSGAIAQADDDLKDGDLVRVLTNHGDFSGSLPDGFYRRTCTLASRC